MRLAALGLLVLLGCSMNAKPPAPLETPKPTARGVLLEDLTWIDAKARLTADTVVVLPIGAAAKEHGPHLLLKNDLLLADYFKRRVLAEADVVILPTLAYHYYPAFVDYAGSTSLRLETARDLTLDVVRSIARFGPRRFYALNTGVSTKKPLELVQTELAKEGVLFRFTDLGAALGPLEKLHAKQPRGSHADEVETSMMLVIAPETVDMSRAVTDMDDKGTGMSPVKVEGKTYSPSGVWGDATLASREKGVKFVEGLTSAILRDLEAERSAPLPTP